MAQTINIYKLVPSQEEMNDLEMRVAKILGWQAGTVEIRETIREFRMGQRPTDRYTSKQIADITEVVSPPQGIAPKGISVKPRVQGQSPIKPASQLRRK